MTTARFIDLYVTEENARRATTPVKGTRNGDVAGLENVEKMQPFPAAGFV